MKFGKGDPSKRVRRERRVKKPYATPRLTVHGTIDEITRGGQGYYRELHVPPGSF